MNYNKKDKGYNNPPSRDYPRESKRSGNGDMSFWDDEPVRPRRETSKIKDSSKAKESSKARGSSRTREASGNGNQRLGRNPRSSRGGSSGGFFLALKNLSAGEGIVITTGVLILVLAVVTGSVYMSAKAVDRQIGSFAELGESLNDLSVVGESSLFAVSEAQASSMSAVIIPTDDDFDDEEEVIPQGEDRVIMNLTSVHKDLKIKFLNGATGKLFEGIGFQVEVKDPSGKTALWEDDDKDGIIYRTKLNPGEYHCTIHEVDAIKDMEYFRETMRVTVKAKIEYKKIDVKDEIKSESQVNVAQEDTAIQEAEVAPSNKDTVDFVTSGKTDASGQAEEYNKIEKSSIPDPGAQAMAKRTFDSFSKVDMLVASQDGEGDILPLTEDGDDENVQNQQGDQSQQGDQNDENDENTSTEPRINSLTISGPSVLGIGETVTLDVNIDGVNLSDRDRRVYWFCSGTNATIDTDGRITGKSPGLVQVNAVSQSFPGAKSPIITIEVRNKPVLSLNKEKISLKAGDEASLSASVSNSTAAWDINWESEDESIAKVDGDGRIKAKKEGKVRIRARATGDGMEIDSYCTVTVSKDGEPAEESPIRFDPGSLQLEVDGSANVTVSIKDAFSPVYLYSVDKQDVISIVTNGNTVNVTGKSEGTANVKVTVTDKDETHEASFKVKVGNSPKDDTTTKLKDKNGHQVYIKDSDGKYVEAVIADYYTATEFFIKKESENIKYTGWQDINGSTYFFDKNGEKVTGSQVIQGVKYEFSKDGVLQKSNKTGVMGIDVSKWNGSIDWSAVKSSGVNYAIIRCGYRGSSTGVLVQDSKFRENLAGAQKAGIRVGVYMFSQAINEVEAVEEASMVLSVLNGAGLSYPVFLDVEPGGGRADGLDKNTRTQIVRAFCETIQSGGYQAGVYANKTWFESKMNVGSLTGYKLWLAQYAAEPTYTASRYDMWQYTSKGTVGGISGKVDLNLSYIH